MDGGAPNLEHGDEEEDEDAGRGQRFILAVAVGMVFVGRFACGAESDEPDDVRRGVGERVVAVGDDADGSGGVAKQELGERHRDVQEQYLEKNAADCLVPWRTQASALRQNTRA